MLQQNHQLPIYSGDALIIDQIKVEFFDKLKKLLNPSRDIETLAN